jgi:hypothetical protein
MKKIKFLIWEPGAMRSMAYSIVICNRKIHVYISLYAMPPTKKSQKAAAARA